MALPSSPPLLAECFGDADLPSSPPLLARTSSLDFPALTTRKRALPAGDSNLSSDPLFSEDPSEAEDQLTYSRPKRKRMVKGPWWTLRTSSRQHSQNPTKDFRNADSGVWLGSDESIDSLLSEARDLDIVETTHASGNARLPSDPPGERIARQVIGDCVESGRETIDISGLGLTEISSDVLKPIHQLIRQSHSTLTEPPSEDEFVPLTPSIQLFLAGNSLCSLPAELFRLENLSVLSLRGNELHEIPHAVASLQSLKEFNIAGNHIKYLPWELIGFFSSTGQQRQITVRPNPLLEPTSFDGPSIFKEKSALDKASGDLLNEDVERLERQCAVSIRARIEENLTVGKTMRFLHAYDPSCPEELIYLASSTVHFFDVDGRPLRKAQIDRHEAVFNPLINAPDNHTSCHAPSLFELALRTMQHVYSLHELPSNLSPTVRSGLEAAARGIDFGNHMCSTCGKDFVIGRAEWIEYWHRGTPLQKEDTPSRTELRPDAILPFKKMVCSWRCATPTLNWNAAPVGEPPVWVWKI